MNSAKLQFDYLNFDLLIECEGGSYLARVTNSPAGEAARRFSVPFSALELENFLLRIGRPRHGVRRLNSPEMEAAKKFGKHLFESVFGGEVLGCLRSSLDQAEAKGSAGLRLRLRLNAPELANLPWEYLYNSALNRFLVLAVKTPLVRYIELPERIRPLAVEPPLKLLAMIASPIDYPQLNVEEEWAKLQNALGELQKRKLVELERLEEATLSALQRRLRQDSYHIFHFIGHGGYDEGDQDGILLLEDETHHSHKLSGQFLGAILHNHDSLCLAVLNACEGARASNADPFSGVAQSLVRQGLPAVIAMQFEITDAAAITFSHEFYNALADGYPVDAALVETRAAIFANGNDVEWGTPVLYMRASDGKVFDFETASQSDTKSLRTSESKVNAPPEGRPPIVYQSRRNWLLFGGSLVVIVLLLAIYYYKFERQSNIITETGVIRVQSLLDGRVYIDGDFYGDIAKGEAQEYEQGIGNHTVQVKSKKEDLTQDTTVAKGRIVRVTFHPKISTREEDTPDFALRIAPRESLSAEAVNHMMFMNGFYCNGWDWSNEWYNVESQGLPNEFVLQANGKLVLDRATNRMWQQSGSQMPGIYAQAQDYIDQLNRERFSGYSDWRLPSLEEAMSLMEHSRDDGVLYLDVIFDRTQRWIWTADKQDRNSPWAVIFSHGCCEPYGAGSSLFVRAVRTGG